MIEVAFTQLLVPVPALAALRGKRFNFQSLEGDLPEQTWHIVGATPDYTLEGDGLQRLRVQVDHWAKTAVVAWQMREATRQFLDGVMAQTLADGTFLDWVEYIGPMDFYDNDAEAYRCGSEFYLHFTYPAAAE